MDSMDTIALVVIWILTVGVFVVLSVWFGPRPSQWQADRGSDFNVIQNDHRLSQVDSQ